MRSCEMKSFASTVTKRTANFALAALLVVSSIAAVGPFIFSEKASAAPAISRQIVGFDSLNLVADRAEPSGGKSISANSLTLTVDSTNASTAGPHHLTEGLQGTLPAGKNSVKADLYIDPSWAGKPVRAGLWGVSSNGTSTGWPIIEFTNAFPGAGHDGLRVWDTNAGTWFPIANPGYGSTVSLEIAINAFTGEYEFYVNNTLAHRYTTDGYNTLQQVIFNNRNSATGNAADNYVVTWTNLQVGVRSLDTPTNLKSVAGGVDVTNGATNVNYGTNSWDAVAGATSYNYEFSKPAGLPTYTGNTTGTSISGEFHSGGSPEGAYAFRVQAVNGAVTSAWSAPSTVIYDITNPAAPQNGTPATTNTNDFYFEWDAVTDSGSPIVEYQFQSSTNANMSSPWQNWVTPAYPDQEKLTTPEIHSQGAGNGTYYWQTRAIDAAGNIGSWSAVWTTVIDSQAPTGLQNLSPSNGAVRTTAAQTQMTWAAATDPNGPVTYFYESSLSDELASDGSFANPAYESPALTANSIPTPNTPEGVYYWHVRAVDTIGNSTPWTGAWKVSVDNTNPTSTSDLQSRVRGAVTVTQTVNDLNADRCKLRIFTTDNTAMPYASSEVAVNADNQCEFTFDSTTLPNGPFVAKFTAWDKAGNASVLNSPFTVDNVAPTVTITVPTLTLIADATPTITGTYNDQDANNDTTILLFIDGSVNGVAVTNNGDGTWTYTPATALTNGTHSFVARASDAIGNTSTSNTLELTIDTVNPTVAVNPAVVEGNAVTFTGTAEVGATLAATFNGTTSSVLNANGTWSFTTSGLANGTYTFSITATDQVGNTATTSTAATIAVAAPAEPTPLAAAITPAITSPATILPVGDVAGASTDNGGDADVAGESTENVAAVDTDGTDGSIFGLAWYWWILILAGIAALIAIIARAIRNRQEA